MYSMFKLAVVICTFVVQVLGENCHYPERYERSFTAITVELFKNNFVPPGDILDVGSHKGEWSCTFACLFPGRIVHAVDPDASNLQRMKCANRGNLRRHQYGLDNSTGWMKYVKLGHGFTEVKRSTDGTGDVKLESLDNMFLKEWKSVPAFMHIDVEGFELQGLQGAVQILDKYLPVFSIEIHVIEKKDFTLELIKFVEERKYTLYMVNEVCGMRKDCRNFICLPPNIDRNRAMS